MTNCCRHLKALTRKNFILWYRAPRCSLLEILTPVILMVVLWIIRLQVPRTSVDKDGVLTKKYPVQLAVTPGPGDWEYGYNKELN